MPPAPLEGVSGRSVLLSWVSLTIEGLGEPFFREEGLSVGCREACYRNKAPASSYSIDSPRAVKYIVKLKDLGGEFWRDVTKKAE